MKNTCQQEYKYRDLFFYMAITALAIYTIAAVANTTIIFADGSGVCVSMLSDKSWYLYDEMRKYGLIIRQIFAIAYLKISDMPQALIFIRLLAFGYAFWNSFFYALAVCICKKRKNDILLYFTFALFTFHFVFCGFNLVLEAGMATAAFWFLFVLYSEKKELHTGWKIISIATLFLLSKVYASVAFFSIILIVLITRNTGIRTIIKERYWCMCICLLIYDEFMSLYFMIFTPYPDARNGLINTLKTITPDFFIFFILWIITGLVLVYFENGTILFWSVKQNEKKHTLNFVILFQILFGVYFLINVIYKAQIYASLNFQSRTLIFLIPIMISAIYLYLYWGNFKLNICDLKISQFAFGLITIISITIAATGYKDYLKSIGAITSHQEGFIDCTKYEVEATGFMTGFTMPLESLLSQLIYRNGEVYISSILVRPEERIEWEPFDSHDIYAYPDLSQYNIFLNYDKFQ